MPLPRGVVTDWVEQGRLAPEALPEALRIAGITPDVAAWRRFIAGLLLSLGTLLVASGVIFFFAYNWQDLGRFGKFALAEVLLVAAAGAAWHQGTRSATGQAALLLATLLTGSLLALIGQTYQTGADPWQLFAWWAALIVAWVVVARTAVLWLLLVALVNLAVILYFQTFPGLFGLASAGESTGWGAFAVNAVALLVWEAFAQRGTPWMQRRWAARLLALPVGAAITALIAVAVLDDGESDVPRWVVYAVWLAAMYGYYRRSHPDVFMLASVVFSAIVVSTAVLARLLPVEGSSVSLLTIGLVIIALSATGARWLARVAVEGDP
jgi:uncharacterized membrane protein